jgi:hypothetical protein
MVIKQTDEEGVVEYYVTAKIKVRGPQEHSRAAFKYVHALVQDLVGSMDEESGLEIVGANADP